jgi:type IV pilus assembly protein PilM
VKLFRRQTYCVGLDIGSYSIKACSVVPQKETWSLEDASVRLSSEDSLVEGAVIQHDNIVKMLRDLVPSSRFYKPKVAFCVSGPSVIAKRIVMQKSEHQNMEEKMMWDIERYVPFNIDEMYIDMHKIEDIPHSNNMSVLLVASKKDFINEYIEVIREADLMPSVCEIPALAVQRVFLQNYVPEEASVHVLLNIGHSYTNMNILVDKKPYFLRDFLTAGKFIENEIKKSYGLSSQEARNLKETPYEDQSETVFMQKKRVSKTCADQIVRDLKRSLDFVSSEGIDTSKTEIYLSGGASVFSFLQEELSNATAFPVHILDPFRKINTFKYGIETAKKQASSMSVALGLAMRSVKAGE